MKLLLFMTFDDEPRSFCAVIGKMRQYLGYWEMGGGKIDCKK